MFSHNLGLIAIEVVVYSIAIALAVLFPHTRSKWANTVTNGFRSLAQRRALSILAILALVFLLRGALIPLLPTPVPGVHDEYSYLLGGQTFAEGRLTNPPHPMWKSLETFYVIQQPTYSSMYPPAQGLFLAVGYLLGNPWLGVLVSVALMCGAICWMLQGWVPPQWALMGGVIAVLRWGVFSYWVDSYWGGAVAALGGALVMGAVPRITRKPGVLAAVVLAGGVLVLANSRPFEGILLCAPAFGYLLIHFWKTRNANLIPLLTRVAVPLALVLLAGAAAMSYYFWRVTGNPLRMPYQLHSATYEVTGPFIWEPLRAAPHYRYSVMQQYHVLRQTAAYVQAHSVRGWLLESWRKVESLLFFYFWPAIIPSVIAIFFLRKSAKVKFALLAAGIMLAGLMLEIWPTTLHYHAPITCIMVLLLVQVMRYWRLIEWRGKPVGIAISRTIPLFCAAILVMRVTAAVLHVPMPDHGIAPWFTVTDGALARAAVEKKLEQLPGQQLVLVRYAPSHHTDEEWVHNAANIDRSKVVWARDADPELNAELLAYFHQRQAWLLDADAKPPRLTKLPETHKTPADSDVILRARR